MCWITSYFQWELIEFPTHKMGFDGNQLQMMISGAQCAMGSNHFWAFYLALQRMLYALLSGYITLCNSLNIPWKKWSRDHFGGNQRHPGHLCVWLGLTWSGGIRKVSQNWLSKMRSGIVHHKSDRKSCVIPTADRNSTTIKNQPAITPWVRSRNSCIWWLPKKWYCYPHPAPNIENHPAPSYCHPIYLIMMSLPEHQWGTRNSANPGWLTTEHEYEKQNCWFFCINFNHLS